MGHAGIAIEHYAYDRCGIEAQERYWRKWHESSPMPACLSDNDISEQTLRKTELVIVTACAAHDIQNAFRWGIGKDFKDKQLVRDLYIGIDSLRNSIELLNRHMAEWIAQKLDFVPDRPYADGEYRRCLWLSLDLEAETAEILAHELQFHFEDGRIKVTEQKVGDPELIDLIIKCLQSAWKFRRFTDSRFMTAGSSCRTLLAAYLLGISDLVDMILDAPGKSPFYLGGFKRLELEENRKIVVAKCAFISQAVEGVLIEILADPRVALRLDELWQVLAEDTKQLLEMDDRIWADIGSIVGSPAADLRDQCLRGAHVSFHFFWRRVLEPAGRLPWSLVQGDMLQNLADMAAEPRPADPVSAKLWGLYNDGYPQQQLLDTLKLLADIPWSTLVVEQQHGTMASIHRHHPEYELNTLMGRTLLMQVRRLLPHMSEDEQQLARLRRELDKALSRQPEKQGARHAIVSQLFGHLRSRCWANSERHVPVDMARRIISSASRILRAATIGQVHSLERTSLIRAAEARQYLNDEADRLRQERDLLLQRMGEEQQVRKPLIMSQCQLSLHDLGRIQELTSGADSMKAKRVEVLRQQVAECPVPVADPVPQKERQRYQWTTRHPQMPAWADRIVENRDFFEDVALAVLDIGEITYWRFVYAVQQRPYYLGLSKLRIDPEHAPYSSVGDPYAAPPRNRYVFHCNVADNHSAEVLAHVKEEEIFVVLGCGHIEGNRLASTSEAMPLRKWIELLPDAEPKSPKGKKQRKRERQSEDLVELFPWASILEEREEFQPREKAHTSDEHERAPKIIDDLNELAEDVLEQTMKELDRARADITEGKHDNVDDFKVKVLGGEWTKIHKKVSFDAVQGICSGSLAIRFCDHRGLNHSKRFGKKGIDFATAAVLSRAWCHRMQFFMNEWFVKPPPKGEAFPKHVQDAYAEPTEFIRLASVPRNATVTAAIAEVRNFVR